MSYKWTPAQKRAQSERMKQRFAAKTNINKQRKRESEIEEKSEMSLEDIMHEMSIAESHIQQLSKLFEEKLSKLGLVKTKEGEVNG